jgi:hypothetical protein
VTPSWRPASRDAPTRRSSSIETTALGRQQTQAVEQGRVRRRGSLWAGHKHPWHKERRRWAGVPCAPDMSLMSSDTRPASAHGRHVVVAAKIQLAAGYLFLNGRYVIDDAENPRPGGQMYALTGADAVEA